MPTDLRCSEVSELLGEPLAGTAPVDERWLFVERPGPWGPKVELAVEGHRVQWIRRVGRTEADPPGSGSRRVFRVDLREGASVRVSTTTLTADTDPDDLPDLPGPTHWQPHHDPLWLVCTNGRRDECCATRGRPVAAALAERWPEDTWETTHLGGHRFAPTLLALPSGYALGRVPPDRVVDAAEQLLAGELPLDLTRGRAGRPTGAQTAELHVRRGRGLTRLDGVQVIGAAGVEGSPDEFCTLRVPDGQVTVRLGPDTGQPRRTSCADVTGKPVTSYIVRTWGTSDP